MPEDQRAFPEPLMGQISKALEEYNATTFFRSLLKGNWKVVLSFLEGEDPGLEGLEAALTEIKQEIDGLEKAFFSRVGSLTPEERRQFMDLADKLCELVYLICYDLQEKEKDTRLIYQLRSDLSRFQSDLRHSCRKFGYPESLVPSRYAQLMNRVRSSGIVDADELLGKPRDEFRHRIKVWKGDVFPLGLLEDYTWFSPPERFEKNNLSSSPERGENRASLLKSIQAYLEAVIRDADGDYESFFIPDHFENFWPIQYARLVKPLLRHPIAQRAELVGIFSHRVDDPYDPPHIHDRFAVFLGQDSVLYGMCLEVGDFTARDDYEGFYSYAHFARRAVQSYSPLLYEEGPLK